MAESGASELNRANPFIARSQVSAETVLLVDRFELPIAGPGGEIWRKIRDSLDLRPFGPLLETSEMITLMGEQFAAAGEFVYGHPFWDEVRHGNQTAVHAYLLETRHYLAAASARMSPSLGRELGLSPLTLLLSQHLLEEWDHAKFFATALSALGCPRDLIAAARPLPTTMEWIHATRQIGYSNSLSAAMCSGFMEFSSTEIDTVLAWHDMLVATNLLPPEANDAIVGHVDTDVAFGHADNWKRALACSGPIRTVEAAVAFNAVATLAEAIYRWLTSLKDGLAGSVVHGMQLLADREAAPVPPHDSKHQTVTATATDMHVAIYDGLPVWPAELMRVAARGDRTFPEAANVVSGLTYALGGKSELPTSPLGRLVTANAARLGSSPGGGHTTVAEIDALATTWLTAIDGHALWDAMAADGPDSLIIGYTLENYHYLASASSHIGAAIASTTSGSLRAQLIAHLEDELTHCELLARRLVEHAGIENPAATRPLSTTVAFVGFLQNVAHQDWKAYLVVSAFLQRSLSELRSTHRGRRFYEKVADHSRLGIDLLGALADHDDIDEGLGHDDRPGERLATLLECGPLPQDSLKHAAVAPALAWSFLDGILQHYETGPAAVSQRVAWLG